MASNANKPVDVDSKKENPALNPTQDSKDLQSELETGGLSAFRQSDHVITRVLEKVEDAIKEEINKLRKDEPVLGKSDKLQVDGYRMNIVNGYMYFAKIKIQGGSFIQAKILETPKGVTTLQTVTETKTEADEKEYFKLPCHK